MSTVNQVLVASTEGGWSVQAPDGRQLSPPLRTQVAAIEVATGILRDGGGGEVLVQGRDGTARRRIPVPPGDAGEVASAPVAGPPSGVGFCPDCGAPRSPGSRFCGSCGSPAGGSAGAGPTTATAPTTSPAVPSPPPVPAWLVTDWPAAVLLAAGALLGLLLVCAAYGMVLGATAAGTDGIIPGLLVGSLLPFSAYGAEMLVIAGDEDANLVLLQDHLPVVLTLAACGITYLALRWGVSRLRGDQGRARALVVKVALVQALVLVVAGAFADVGDLDDMADGFTAITGVSQGHAGFVALLLALLVGALALRRAGLTATPVSLPVNARRFATAAGTGAMAWLLLVGVLGVATVAGIGVAVDGTRERGTVAAAAPLLIGGTGVAASAVAHGGAAGYVSEAQFESDEGDSEESEDADGARLSSLSEREEHTSLLHWALPITDDEDDTPWWAYLLLVAPLAALAAATVLLLRRAAPPTESWAVGLALAMGGGYVAASGVLSKVIGLSIAGRGSELEWGFPAVVARPGPGSSVGLPLLWALVVCSITAFVWARRRRLPGSVFGALATSAPAAPATTSATAGSGSHGFCGSCGAPLVSGAGYCGSCGALAGAAQQRS
jgi:hypothetical protein